MCSNTSKHLFPFVALLMTPISANYDAAKLTGQWSCGPYVMEGRGIKVTSSEQVTYGEGGEYIELGSSTTELQSGEKITIQTKTSGSWVLEQEVIGVKLNEIKVLSSDHMRYTVEIAQKSADEQLRKKDWSKHQVLELSDRLTTNQHRINVRSNISGNLSCEKMRTA